MTINETSIIARLSSDDTMTVMDCLDEVLEYVALGGQLSLVLRTALISNFTKSDVPDLIAEKISIIAGQLESELQQLLISEASLNAKFWASLILLHINNRAGISILLSVIETRSHPSYLFAAAKLAQINERSAISAIQGALKALDSKHIDEIVALLDTLEKFGEPLLPIILAKFSSEDIPWQIKSMLAQF